MIEVIHAAKFGKKHIRKFNKARDERLAVEEEIKAVEKGERFDRKKYQRELMRKRRAAAKEQKEDHPN